mgnify:CR=1 FL=1
MGGYILEVLAGRTWRREGTTFWTKGDAKREAERILRRGKAVEIRILPVNIGEDAIECLPARVPEVDDATE